MNSVYEVNNLRFSSRKYREDLGNSMWIVDVTRVSDGHYLPEQMWFRTDTGIDEQELKEIAQYWQEQHLGLEIEPAPVYCYACGSVLTSDSDTNYQFDNCLWINFSGGYGMFVDNTDATMCTNLQDRWLRDDSNGAMMIDDDEKDLAIDNPDFEPLYSEDRVVARSDYECVICHDCAHDLCRITWLNKLLNPSNSHAHHQEYIDNNPKHRGWDIDRKNAS